MIAARRDPDPIRDFVRAEMRRADPVLLACPRETPGSLRRP
jgi:hypothetical protein